MSAMEDAERAIALAGKEMALRRRFPHRRDLLKHCAERELEVERLKKLIDTPETADWMKGVALEAAHQQERWGSAHDAGKGAPDWFWLLGHLAGKALAAAIAGNIEKLRHHTISSGAVLLNWHRHASGEMTAMRPGIAPPKDAA
jgi:hypothetical protein